VVAWREFLVSVNVPDGVGVREMRAYLREAVVTWAKGGDPENPLFDLRDRDVKVSGPLGERGA
jgi:hypothetical protein